jgi:hypothetical protein
VEQARWRSAALPGFDGVSPRKDSMHQLRRHAYALAVTAATFSAAGVARAADKPAEPQVITIAPVDHREEFALRAGLEFPGEVTPKNLLVGKTGIAPTLFAEASFVVHPFFTVGAFAQLSSADYQHFIHDQSVDDGRLTLASAGGSFKARIPLSDSFVLRVGLLAGANLSWVSGSGQGGSYGAHGAGFDLAPTVEGAWRVASGWGMSGQFTFVAQPFGTISIDGDSNSHDLAFAPIYLLSIGPEFYL